MLEKVKTFLGAWKDAILFIVAPILGVLAYVFYLRSRNEALSDENADLKTQTKEAALIEQKDETTHAADQASSDYVAIRDRYIKEHLGD